MTATNRLETDVVSHRDFQTQISGLDRFGILFGKKLAASLSPFLHQVIYRDLNLRWGQVRLDSADIDLFLRLIRHPQFYGASVTMPNKVAIMPHLDVLTPECRDVGACNTVFVREAADADARATTGRRLFCGANTDVVGVRESFLQNVPDPAAVFTGRPAMVIGGGGAARSAVYALRTWLGVTDIYIVNRDRGEVEAVVRDCTARGFGGGLVHVETVGQAEALEDPGAIVACVPDFPPRTEEEKRARRVTEVFFRDKPHKGAMLEMCYNPTPYTALGALAAGAGWQVILGTEALIYQGLEQHKYWSGLSFGDLPVQEVRQAIAAKLAKHAKL